MFGLKIVKKSYIEQLENKVERLRSSLSIKDMLNKDWKKRKWIYDLSEEQVSKVIAVAFHHKFTGKKNAFEALEIAKEKVIGDENDKQGK